MGEPSSVKLPCVLGVVGYSGAGKTTLIENVLPHLVGRGLRVAVMKHSHHTIDLDMPGKDSWRHKQAGATMSMLVTPHQVQVIQDLAPQAQLSSLIMQYCAEMDLVLLEGDTHAAVPKIEVWRREVLPQAAEIRSMSDIFSQLRCTADTHLIAVVTPLDDGLFETQGAGALLPLLPLNDPIRVAQFIAQWVLASAPHANVGSL